MLNVTPQFRQALYDGNRNYIETVKITLTDGTVLNLTNEDIWQGGMSFEDAVSSDSDFQIGTAIINKQKLQINNLYEDYTDYIFEGADVITNIGLVIDDQGTVERIRKGTFIVDTADYDDTIVTLNLLDKMSLFEKPYSDISITYPSQAQFVITMICNHCGVTLATTNFPHKTFMITQGPDKDTCSCREVIAWIAQICGCFARCNVNGELELKWYDTNALDSFISGLDGGVFDTTSSASYETGDEADGGSFNPWSTGYEYDSGDFTQIVNNVHVIGSTFSHTISLDDVVITGLRIVVKNGTGTGNEVVTYSRGTAGYIVEISENGFITTVNADTIADWLATQLIGLRFRKANISIPSDPSIEAGDVGVIFDKRGNQYPILVSKTTFSPYGQQTVVSSAQTPARNSSAGQTVETKNYVELRKQLKEQMSTWEEAEEDLREAISNANGLFTTDIEDPQTHAVTHYLHNKGPDGTSTDRSGLNASDIRIMISDVGITMTANGTAQTPTWYGLTVDGNFIASVIRTINAFFDNAHGGTLTLGGLNNGDGELRVLDASNVEVGRWNNNGIQLLKGLINLGNGKFTVDTNGVVSMVKGTVGGIELTTNGLVSKSEDGEYYKIFSISKKGAIQAYKIAKADTESQSSSVIYIDGEGYISKLPEESTVYQDTDIEMYYSMSGAGRLWTMNFGNDYWATNGRILVGSLHNSRTFTPDELIPSGTIIAGDVRLLAPQDGNVTNLAAHAILVRTENKGLNTYVNRFLVRYNGDMECAAIKGDTLQLGLMTFGTGSTVVADGSGNFYLSSSSKRYKDYIADMTDEEAEKLYDLPVVEFKYKDGYLNREDELFDKPLYGFFAEDVAELFPDGVVHNKTGDVENYSERAIIARLVKTVQIQHKEIDELKAMVSQLLANREKEG